MEKLQSKIIIAGTIRTLTGLHIGGSKSALEIGGVDLNVIKTYQGIPYIPGTSLKGKLRWLAAREKGSDSVEKDPPEIARVFGRPESMSDDKKYYHSRLKVRDAYARLENGKSRYAGAAFDDVELELGYTEVKWENTIKRINGEANPRQLERVPENVGFAFSLVYDKMSEKEWKDDLQLILTTMRLLQDDYLGGQGSRGYGKIAFEDVALTERTIEQYRSGHAGTLLQGYSI